MKHRTAFAGVALALASLLAQAHEFKLGALTVGHPVARATAPGQPVGGAFMTITNAGPDDRLLSISAPNAASVELHTMKMEGDVMRMREVDGIPLPAGQTVKLQAGGYHVMLMGLKAPLQAGDRFPATLKFEKAGELKVEINVEAASGAPMKH